MKYPENEPLLIVRPCLKFICLGIRPAAKLLSLLLYYARNCSEDQAEYTFSCTQDELIEGLIDEMDVKTLHRSAIPVLRLLGYLDVDGSSYRYHYTIHLDLIRHLLGNYKDKQKVSKIIVISMVEQLEKLPTEIDKFPIVFSLQQLEKCLNEIDKCPIELDKLPIELEKCLIPFRQMSNSKRGRKPRLEAIPKPQFRKPQIIESNKNNKNTRDLGVSATAPTQTSLLSEKKPVNNAEAPTEKLPVVRPPTPEPSKPPVTFRPPKRPKPPESEDQKQSEAARKRAVTQRIQEIRTLYNTLMRREVTWSRDNQEGAKQLAESKDATDEDIKATVKDILKDRFWGPQITLKVVAKKIDARVVTHQPTPSNGHMPAMPRDKNETRVISSFGTPGFDFAAEFYPSEAEKRAARAAQQ